MADSKATSSLPPEDANAADALPKSQEGSAPSTIAKATSKVPVPKQVTSLASTTDRTILRLAKLLQSPGGLGSFLSTLNYSLYVIVALQPSLPSLSTASQSLLHILNYRRASPSSTEKLQTTVPAAPTSLAALAGMLSSTRTTLRLTGLFPLYTLMRSLLKTKSPQDSVLHTIAIAQAIGYIGFQSLENISHLTNSGVISPATLTRIGGAKYGTSAKTFLWSCRFWLMGITMSFLKLAREAQLESKRRAVRARMSDEGKNAADEADDDEATDKKWWSQLFVAASWWPMALHYSVEGGIGMPFGVVGLLGVMAGAESFRSQWDATKDVK